MNSISILLCVLFTLLVLIFFSGKFCLKNCTNRLKRIQKTNSNPILVQNTPNSNDSSFLSIQEIPPESRLITNFGLDLQNHTVVPPTVASFITWFYEHNKAMTTHELTEKNLSCPIVKKLVDYLNFLILKHQNLSTVPIALVWDDFILALLNNIRPIVMGRDVTCFGPHHWSNTLSRIKNILKNFTEFSYVPASSYHTKNDCWLERATIRLNTRPITLVIDIDYLVQTLIHGQVIDREKYILNKLAQTLNTIARVNKWVYPTSEEYTTLYTMLLNNVYKLCKAKSVHYTTIQETQDLWYRIQEVEKELDWIISHGITDIKAIMERLPNELPEKNTYNKKNLGYSNFENIQKY